MTPAPETRNVGKLVRDLQRRKARERRGIVVAEGRRLVQDAIGAGAAVLGLLVADDVAVAAGSGLVAWAREGNVPLEIVPRRDFDAMADTETPSGVLAAVSWAPTLLEALPPPPAAAVVLVLDGVQDPGNTGTMLRTANALGAWCTIALDGTADVRSPKVVRAAMGAHFRHPVVEAAFADALAFLGRRGFVPCLAVMHGVPAGAPAPDAPRLALVVGSEGRGIREGWPDDAARVTVAMKPGAESLNAAVAAGILLHELGRTRG